MTDINVTASLNAGGENSIAVTMQQLRMRQKERRDALLNMRDPYAQAAVWLDRWAQTNFRTEGGNVGGWVPFAVGGRRKKDGTVDLSAKLLQDTGRARASVMPFHTADDAGIFSDLAYLGHHHRGEGVPQRRVLPRPIEVRDDVRRIIQGHVARAINKNAGVRS